MGNYKEELREYIRERAVVFAEVTLSSGAKSNYYIDCKQVTLDAKGAFLIGEVLLGLLDDADAIGGLTIGADPIATAVSMRSYKNGRPIPAFIVRKGQKAHGMMKRIEGPVAPGSKVIIVDDVITKGGSVIEAIEAAESEGHSVVKVICLIDRQQGGGDLIKSRGYKLEALFTPADLGLEVAGASSAGASSAGASS
ncbi:MAG: orotate phosphoribosyltransferase, partial [Actinobacteria bacterium]|nr:orotate phosphoribosyltransferase [Actinomycetota bacterium]